MYKLRSKLEEERLFFDRTHVDLQEIQVCCSHGMESMRLDVYKKLVEIVQKPLTELFHESAMKIERSLTLPIAKKLIVSSFQTK